MPCQYAAQHDFAGFYDTGIALPQLDALSSILRAVQLFSSDNQLDEALLCRARWENGLNRREHEGVRVLGPAAAPIMRLKRDYRYHFVLKSPSREKAECNAARHVGPNAVAQKIPRTQVIVDVDAIWLM